MLTVHAYMHTLHYHREIPRYGPLWFGAFRLCEKLDMRDARLAIRTRQLQSSSTTASASASTTTSTATVALSTRPDMLDTAAIRNTAGVGPHTAQQDAAAASLDTAAAAPLERFAAFGTHNDSSDTAAAADDNALLQCRFRGTGSAGAGDSSGATTGAGASSSSSNEPQLLRTQKVLLRAQENISKELVWKVCTVAT
jgi:hypothetical protein